MKYAFVNFEKQSNIYDSYFNLKITYLTDESISYMGTELGEGYTPATIEKAASQLLSVVKEKGIDQLIFNYPVVLKSKENPVEVGLRDTYIWKLKCEYKKLVSDQRDVENSRGITSSTHNITLTINGDFDSQKFLQKLTEEIKKRGVSAI